MSGEFCKGKPVAPATFVVVVNACILDSKGLFAPQSSCNTVQLWTVRSIIYFANIEQHMDRTIHTQYVDLCGPYGPYDICDIDNIWIVRST